MKNATSTVLLTIALCSCGGSSSESPALNAALPGVHQATTGNPYEESTLAYSAQQVTEQANETALLTVAPEFEFKTSKTVELSVGFPEAQGRRATALICTDYSIEQEVHKVNYDSCLLRAQLVDGQLNQKVAVLNRYSKVLAVAWFAEPGSAPLFKEIDL